MVLAVDHELAGQHDIVPELLSHYPAILPSFGTFTRKIINSLFAGIQDQLNIVLETNYLETIKVMAAANLGWSILPESMVDSSLVAHDLHGLDVQRPLGIVTHKGRTLSLSAEAMIELLREHRQRNPST